MIEIGKKQILRIERISAHGAHLAADNTDGESVLLPGKEIPREAKVGQEIEVFVYLDSEDRKIATTREPGLKLGEIAVLTVKEVTAIGAFLDWGLEKDLFLPFKEQTGRIDRGMNVPVRLYTDKSGRLCATMRIERQLSAESGKERDDFVWGTVYRINPQIGVFVAVENRYFGLIQAKDIAVLPRIGDRVEARVTRVRSDGKLNLHPQKKAYQQIGDDTDKLMDLLEMYQGVLPFSDKASPELIKQKTGMTKNAFKRAVGHMLKEGKIRIEENAIQRL